MVVQLSLSGANQLDNALATARALSLLMIMVIL